MTDMAGAPAAARVRRCGPDDVIALRRAVLRPHLNTEEARYEADYDPATAHFCAEDDEGRVVSVATVLKQAPPWPIDEPVAWRLRGMASVADWRGRGAGAEVLASVFGYVAASGGGLLWCSARLGAVDFYKRAGMTTTGEPWEEPVIGPHVAMFINIRGEGPPGPPTGN